MKDRALAVVAAIGALAYLYADWRIPRLQLGDPLGPRAFPALVGILLLVSAVLLAIESRKQPGMPGPVRSAVTVPKARQTAPHAVILTAMLAWTLCYYVAFEPVGYVIATVVYLFGLLCVFHRKRHATNLAIALGFTAIAYVVFSQLLGVQLPLGWLSA